MDLPTLVGRVCGGGHSTSELTPKRALTSSDASGSRRMWMQNKSRSPNLGVVMMFYDFWLDTRLSLKFPFSPAFCHTRIRPSEKSSSLYEIIWLGFGGGFLNYMAWFGGVLSTKIISFFFSHRMWDVLFSKWQDFFQVQSYSKCSRAISQFIRSAHVYSASVMCQRRCSRLRKRKRRSWPSESLCVGGGNRE